MTDARGIHAAARHSLQFTDAFVRNFETEEQVIPVIDAHAPAVDKQLHGRLVGIDLHQRLFADAVHIALSADVDEGILRKPGLVCVERILLILAVDGHEAFGVLSLSAALFALVRAEIEHVPDMGRPQIRALLNLTDHCLVIQRLIFFGIVTFPRIPGVPVQAVGAVLRQSQCLIRMVLVNPIQNRSGLLRGAFIPAQIQVIGDHIRQIDNVFF